MVPHEGEEYEMPLNPPMLFFQGREEEMERDGKRGGT
jgi:hypothetical protein